MPPIDPAALRERAAAIAERYDQPAILARGVRLLLEDYADRTHRPSPKIVTSGTSNSFKVPGPVLRALSAALRRPARAAGPQALQVAGTLWAAGSREERRLAAEVLGQVAIDFPAETLALAETWAAQVESGETADALAENGLGPLVLARPSEWIERARRWATYQQRGARRLGVAVLLPLARDRHWDNVPAALSVLHLLMNEPDGDVRRAVANVLEHLARKSPAEIARFLREQAARANNNSSWIIRTALTALEPADQAEIIRILRG
jgi:3-methyladenine DNA glycosylase AlkC